MFAARSSWGVIEAMLADVSIGGGLLGLILLIILIILLLRVL